MYENNNYTYTANYSPVEPEPPKGGKGGKIAAFILSAALIGGASGFGGGYLANSLTAEKTVSQASENMENVSDKAETTETIQTVTAVPQSSDGSENSIGSLLNVDSEKTGEPSTKEVIKNATPSVALIKSEFTEAGEAGTGTGIVISADGYIMTNCHVIRTTYNVRSSGGYDYNNPFSFFGSGYSYEEKTADADKVTVTLYDGSEHEAEIVGRDENTDLAILKIDVKGLIPAIIGDSNALEMGDEVLTLGYPAGMGLSASRGIVSGLEKEVTTELSSGTIATMTLIQTDAAINPGNSGGPLLNSKGEVVGITSSKLSSVSVEGIGFAIPITDAMSIVDDLMSKGYVAMPNIGISGIDVTDIEKRYYNLDVSGGVLVMSVEAGSCAETAGIAEGDIIVAADGKEISDMSELVTMKNKHKPGETMTVTLARKDGNIDVELILDEKPREE
ncbi:MAG: trypsin-like peptidase domain-containing protein [Ruminococcus sp.]|nr:trypsin-like peptidase domain-containing protein [Ruminococcus sp.]MCM1380650.1 trypsin-like peptidase domain-containing protein [Muribaculaceae bacterium]MCM1480376.1 trypsin-like peptidase domain-containing protein [Muribaculaceae bacterium]